MRGDARRKRKLSNGTVAYQSAHSPVIRYFPEIHLNAYCLLQSVCIASRKQSAKRNSLAKQRKLHPGKQAVSGGNRPNALPARYARESRAVAAHPSLRVNTWPVLSFPLGEKILSTPALLPLDLDHGKSPFTMLKTINADTTLAGVLS